MSNLKKKIRGFKINFKLGLIFTCRIIHNLNF